MAAVRTDVSFVVNFIWFFFLLYYKVFRVIAGNQSEEIRPQRIFIHVKTFHMQCLNDKLEEDEERFYCWNCCPAGTWVFVKFIIWPFTVFLYKQNGFKILHQNVNGIYQKLDQIKSVSSESKKFRVVGFSKIHPGSTVTDAELNIQG